jgi:hypothetical protein
MAKLARPLHSKHRLQNAQKLFLRSLRQTPQASDKSIPIYNPQLFGYNVAVFAIKPTKHRKKIWVTASG